MPYSVCVCLCGVFMYLRLCVCILNRDNPFAVMSLSVMRLTYSIWLVFFYFTGVKMSDLIATSLVALYMYPQSQLLCIQICR